MTVVLYSLLLLLGGGCEASRLRGGRVKGVSDENHPGRETVSEVTPHKHSTIHYAADMEESELALQTSDSLKGEADSLEQSTVENLTVWSV